MYRRKHRPGPLSFLFAVALIGLVLPVAAGCGKSGEVVLPPDSLKLPVLEPEQALGLKDGEETYVEGYLFLGAKRVVLASALLESYPPLPGGPTLPLSGLKVGDLVGLSSAPEGPGLPEVKWSDYLVTLRGKVNKGALEVTARPRVLAAEEGDLALRFSPVSEPLRSGRPVWWVFDVTNKGSKAVVLTFASGQRAEVVLSLGGEQAYRWSSGRAFTEAIETVSLEPGATMPVVLNDDLNLEPGQYELSATVTASVKVSAETVTLPALSGLLTVH